MNLSPEATKFFARPPVRVALFIAWALILAGASTYLYGVKYASDLIEPTATGMGAVGSLILGVLLGRYIQFKQHALDVSSELLGVAEKTREAVVLPTQELPPYQLDERVFTRRLVSSQAALAELAHFTLETLPEPSATPLARYLAEELDSAHIMDVSASLGEVNAVFMPRNNSVFFIPARELAFDERLQMLTVEALVNRVLILNRMRIVSDATTREEIERLALSLEQSCILQLPATFGHVSEEDVATSEWDVRQALATGLETLVVPYRLEATFRVNVERGVAAYRITLPESELFTYATSEKEARQLASDYALRLGLLLAAYTYRVTASIQEVWVLGLTTRASETRCLYSAVFTREFIETRNLAAPFSPAELYTAASANFQLEDGILQAVIPTFTMRDPRLNPSWRRVTVENSTRRIPQEFAQTLGATCVSDLAIQESSRRERLAQELASQMTSSAQANVQILLEAQAREEAGEKDPLVLDATRRSIAHLIEGSWENREQEALLNEFAQGDELTQAVQEALAAMLKKDNHHAIEVLTHALYELDTAGLYFDSPAIPATASQPEEPAVAWRYFDSYANRTLYPHLRPDDTPPGAELRLVPEPYFTAQLLLSSAYLCEHDYAHGLLPALRAQELSPLSTNAALRVARCYESLGELEMAHATLVELLEFAHDPETLGVAYYRLAFIAHRMEHDKLAAALYSRSLAFLSTISTQAKIELMDLEKRTGITLLPQEVNSVIEAARIPLAPTQTVSHLLVECAKASVNAGIFPVAKQLTSLLCLLSGDDAMASMVDSFDEGPLLPEP
jgi:hypothetical protein